MVYINKLQDLNPRSAKVESIALMRDIKKDVNFPLSQEKLKDQLTVFFFSKTDIDAMAAALECLPQVLMELAEILKENLNCYEPVNVQRTMNGLQEIPEPLNKNMDYAKRIFEWQDEFVPYVTALFNELPTLRTLDEKKVYEEKLKNIFAKILRQREDFAFKYADIINEAQVSRIRNLEESIKNGFLFNVKMDEYLLKKDFSMRSRRIPTMELDRIAQLNNKMMEIKRGVERAYDGNMRMIQMAILLFTYIEWLKGQIR
ncbi:hypothetical protein HZB01_03230 [Candidatus Woesearchaeota archaeon]|nr:hypothetical protein [Candidatus Woesearchaeota archaeon]